MNKFKVADAVFLLLGAIWFVIFLAGLVHAIEKRSMTTKATHCQCSKEGGVQ